MAPNRGRRGIRKPVALGGAAVLLAVFSSVMMCYGSFLTGANGGGAGRRLLGKKFTYDELLAKEKTYDTSFKGKNFLREQMTSRQGQANKKKKNEKLRSKKWQRIDKWPQLKKAVAGMRADGASEREIREYILKEFNKDSRMIPDGLLFTVTGIGFFLGVLLIRALLPGAPKSKYKTTYTYENKTWVRRTEIPRYLAPPPPAPTAIAALAAGGGAGVDAVYNALPQPPEEASLAGASQ